MFHTPHPILSSPGLLINPITESQVVASSGVFEAIRRRIVVAGSNRARSTVAALGLGVNVEHIVLTSLSSSSTMSTHVGTDSADHVSSPGTTYVISSTSSSTHSKIPHSRAEHGVGANLTVFTTTFDTLVAVLVKIGKVLPEFLVSGMNKVSVLNGGKLAGQGADSGNVEFVLVRL